MGDNATLWLPEQASTLAPEIDSLFYFVYWTSIVIFVGTMAAMLYFVYKYRRKNPEDRPPAMKDNKLVEASWIVVPTILVLIVFVWGFQTFIKIGVAPPDAYEIRVTAKKWLWEFTYPDAGLTTTNELRVPVGRPIKLVMSSEDVIHSLFIPAFRVKHDVLPNRYTSVWFTATRTSSERPGPDGEPLPFHVFCTEYCGTQHSQMAADLYVETQEDFEAWLESGGGMEDLPLPQLGARLYEQQGCNACHSVDGSRKVGPTFTGLYGAERPLVSGETVEADANYLRAAILEPGAQIVEGYQNIMPASYGSLSEQQLNALIAFIEEQ